MSRPAGETVSFRDYVELRQKDAYPRRKGERTRDRIRLAAVELLNEVGYREMKVSDVCERAGITPPVLYLYFQNKLALTEDVLREFLDTFMSRSETVIGQSAHDAIYQANLRWISSARANAGLIRCLLQVSDEIPEFAEVLATANEQWYARIAQGVIKRFPQSAVEEPQIRLAVYALGGMMDELTRKLFAATEHPLARLAGEVTPGDEALAQFMTGLWVRALYGVDPALTGGQPPLPRLNAASRLQARRDARRRAKAAP